MKIKLFFALLLAFLLAFGALAEQKAAVSDDAIYDNVRRKLASDRDVRGGALQVDVKDGVVTLSGTLGTEKQKERAGKLTKKIKGVKSVENRIVVATREGGQ